MHFLSTRKQPNISNIYAYMLKFRVTRDMLFLVGGSQDFSWAPLQPSGDG